jgi:hypothetical protein
MGLLNGAFKVFPYRSLGYNVALTAGGGDSTSSAPLFNTSSSVTETITAWRTGFYAEREGCVSGTIPHYALSGVQVAIVEELADPKVLALQTVLATAGEVIFPAINVPVASREWIFIAGDTAAQPLTPVSGASRFQSVVIRCGANITSP